MDATTILLFTLFGGLITLYIWMVTKFHEMHREVVDLHKRWNDGLEDLMAAYQRDLAVQSARWQKERSDLLDRITAGNLAEYKHLTGERQRPRVANPLTRKSWDDIGVVNEEVTPDGNE